MGDILLYEIAATCQGIDENGESFVMSFEHTRERVDKSIAQICYQAGGTQPPIIYLTGKNNFRERIAKRREYKKGRPEDKPFHYYNIKGYLIQEYGAIVVDGMEADDALCINQEAALSNSEADDTIICSRDKDLKQCRGYHFSWECGKQPSIGPLYVEGYGSLELKNSKKLTGTGHVWFFAQCLMGDTTDTIPGIKGYGPVKTYNLLKDASSYREGQQVVIDCYKEAYGDRWEEELLEQARLVWMVRDLDDEGNPLMWEITWYD
jgi:5'-3' exonuclease